MSSTGLGRWAWITDVLLFLSSYAVMFGALALRFDSPKWLRWACVGLCVAGALSAAYIVTMQRRLAPEYATIKEVDDRGADVSGYLATYLLPLVVISAPNINDIVAYTMIFATMGVVYVRSRLIQVNPTLYLLGFRLFYILSEDGFAGYLLSRREPSIGDRLRIVQRDRLLLQIGGTGVQANTGDSKH